MENRVFLVVAFTLRHAATATVIAKANLTQETNVTQFVIAMVNALEEGAIAEMIAQSENSNGVSLVNVGIHNYIN